MPRWVVDYALLAKRIHPATVAGALVSMAFFTFLDAILVADRALDQTHRFTFVMSMPIIFSILGLCVVNMTQPADFHDITVEAAKSRGFLFAGWVLLTTGSVTSLVQCGVNFVGMGTRESVFPGVAMVLITTLFPLATVALWWSKGVVHSSSDEFEW